MVSSSALLLVAAALAALRAAGASSLRARSWPESGPAAPRAARRVTGASIAEAEEEEELLQQSGPDDHPPPPAALVQPADAALSGGWVPLLQLPAASPQPSPHVASAPRGEQRPPPPRTLPRRAPPPPRAPPQQAHPPAPPPAAVRQAAAPPTGLQAPVAKLGLLATNVSLEKPKEPWPPKSEIDYSKCDPPCIQGRGICNDKVCFCRSPFTGSTCSKKVDGLYRASIPMVVGFAVMCLVLGIIMAKLVATFSEAAIERRLERYGQGKRKYEMWQPPEKKKKGAETKGGGGGK